MRNRKVNQGEKAMRNSIFILVLALSLSLTACMTTSKVRSKNQLNLTMLSLGMTKSEVLSVMGIEIFQVECCLSDGRVGEITNPYRTETFQTENGSTYEILFYYTDIKKDDGSISNDELTPIVLRDDKVIGWGRTFLGDNVKKYQIDIR